MDSNMDNMDALYPVRATGVVDVHHHMYYLSEGEGIPRLRAMPRNGLIVVDVDTGWIFVGASDGLVNVSVEARHSPPAVVNADGWDEVVEVSMSSDRGLVRVTAGMSRSPDLPAITAAGPGHYRVRLHARGRDTAPDLVAFEPAEDYLLVAWPGPTTPEIVYKQTDAYGATLRRSVAGRPPIPPKMETHEDRWRTAFRENLERVRPKHVGDMYRHE